MLEISEPSLLFQFIRAGRGISRRRRALNEIWVNHLAETKKQIRNCFKDNNKQDSIAILGAGRLYDVELKELAEKFKKIILVDADYLSRVSWIKEKSKVTTQTKFEFITADITTVLSDWKKEFNQQVKNLNWNESIFLLRDFKAEICCSKFLEFPKTSAIISLNLLSQIPLVWQNIVEKVLLTKFGQKNVKEKEEEWINALIPTAQLLIRQHLRDLALFKAEKTLIISDTAYFQYKLGNIKTQAEMRQLSWHYENNIPISNLPQIEQDKIKIEELSSLFALNLKEELDKYFSDKKMSFSNPWLWHIQPQYFETDHYGTLNKVQAVVI